MELAWPPLRKELLQVYTQCSLLSLSINGRSSALPGKESTSRLTFSLLSASYDGSKQKFTDFPPLSPMTICMKLTRCKAKKSGKSTRGACVRSWQSSETWNSRSSQTLTNCFTNTISEVKRIPWLTQERLGIRTGKLSQPLLTRLIQIPKKVTEHIHNIWCDWT